MKTVLLKLALSVAVAGFLAAGCVVYTRPREVVVTAPPPPPAAEVVVGGAPPDAPAYVDVVPASPGVDFVWIPGAWFWAGGRWEWQRGRWDRPPRRGMVWVGHHYEYRGGRHVFVEGHWR